MEAGTASSGRDERGCRGKKITGKKVRSLLADGFSSRAAKATDIGALPGSRDLFPCSEKL